VIGVVEDGAGWVAVLDLAGDPGLLAAASTTPLAVPLGPLVTALSTEDIQLSTVQLVVHTAPARLAAPGANHGLPPALQAGWLALRVSAETALTGAGRSAGTGKAGLDRVQRALRRGVDRAVETLHGLDVAAQPLDSDGLRAAFGLATAGRPATAGAPAEPATEHWTGWQCAGAGHACYAVRDWPPAGLAALLGALATVPAHAVTLAVTVTVDRPEPALTGVVRVTDQTVDAARRAGDLADQAVASTGARLRRLDGEHAAAVIATVPLGATRPGATR
jgi:type VII secretion protein EccE